MTLLSVLYSFVVLLGQSEQLPIVGTGVNWLARDQIQESWLRNWYDVTKGEFSLLQTIDCSVSTNTEDINGFLARHKVEKRLDPATDGALMSASYYNFGCRIQSSDVITEIQGADGKTYPAIECHNVAIFKSNNHDQPVIRISNSNGNTVFMTATNKPPIDQWDLVQMVEKASLSLIKQENFGQVIFPMVSCQQVIDAPWIEGLYANGKNNQPIRFGKTVQIIFLQLGQKATETITPVAGAVIPQIGVQQTMFINTPFLLWVEQENLSKPLIAAYVSFADWKNPEPPEPEAPKAETLKPAELSAVEAAVIPPVTPAP